MGLIRFTFKYYRSMLIFKLELLEKTEPAIKKNGELAFTKSLVLMEVYMMTGGFEKADTSRRSCCAISRHSQRLSTKYQRTSGECI